MTHQALTPFARKLAETMFQKDPKWWGADRWRIQCDEAEPHGWTQKNHEALLDRPRVVEP